MGRPKQFDPDVAVERAMDVFWRKGYERTTPQDLVDELGIGKGSLYNTFGYKRALFDLALRRYGDTRSVAVIDVLEDAGRPVCDRLRTALGMVIELDLMDPDRRGCLAVNTAAAGPAAMDAEAMELVRRMFDRTEAAFKAAIEDGQRAGEIDAARDAAALASLLLNTVVGLHVIGKADRGPERMHRVVDAVLDLL